MHGEPNGGLVGGVVHGGQPEPSPVRPVVGEDGGPAVEGVAQDQPVVGRAAVADVHGQLSGGAFCRPGDPELAARQLELHVASVDAHRVYHEPRQVERDRLRQWLHQGQTDPGSPQKRFVTLGEGQLEIVMQNVEAGSVGQPGGSQPSLDRLGLLRACRLGEDRGAGRAGEKAGQQQDETGDGVRHGGQGASNGWLPPREPLGELDARPHRIDDDGPLDAEP